MYILCKQYFEYSEESYFRDNGYETQSIFLFTTLEECISYLDSINCIKINDIFYQKKEKECNWREEEEYENYFYKNYNPDTGILKEKISEADCYRYIFKPYNIGEEFYVSFDSDYFPKDLYIDKKPEMNKELTTSNIFIRKGKEEVDMYHYWAENKYSIDMTIEYEGVQVNILEIALYIIIKYDRREDNYELAWDIFNSPLFNKNKVTFNHFFKGKTLEEVVNILPDKYSNDFKDMIVD